MKTALAVVALTLMLANGVGAQEQRAAIEGVVRDPQGGVVPNVAVVALGAVGFAIDTMTDGSGIYRFASLQPGAYELIARLDGFLPARIVNIELTLGVQLSIDLILEPAGPNETIEVVRESPLIAVTQSARALNIRDEQIERLPRGRDFTSLAILAPGVNDERKLAGISIDGSSGAENRIVIDGVETTDTWVGTPGQFLVTDLIDELQVKSSGYSAEYGGSTGGVLNAITKTGSNTWRGEALLYWSGDTLDTAPRPTLQLVPTEPSRAEYVTFPEDDYRQLEPGFTLGGPIVRDRIWFFGGYVPSFRRVERTVKFLADGTTRSFQQFLDRQHAAVNLSAQLDPRWRAKATFSTGRQTQRGLLPALNGSSNPEADYSIDNINPNYSASVSVDFAPNSRTFLSFRTGYFFKDRFDEGVYDGDRYVYAGSSVDVPGVPSEYQRPLLYSNVPSNSARTKGKGPHLGVQFDGTLFFSAVGQHQLKSGIQFDRVGLDTFVGDTGNFIVFHWGQSFNATRGPFGYYRVFSSDRHPNQGFITEGNASVNNLGLFIQDAWTVSKKVTVHLGLRTENEVVPSLSTDSRVPKTAIGFGFADKLAPRLGFAWDVGGDRQTKVYGSWGVYYDITKLQISFGFGGFSLVNNWYTLDSGDVGAIVDNPECPPACPGRLIRGPVGSTVLLNNPDDNRIDPNLKQMRLQEAVIGVEHEIAPRVSISARYIHKQLDRVLEDVGTQDARLSEMTIIRIANPGFGSAATFFPPGATMPVPLPKARRDYDAVEVGIDRRHFGRWSSRISYTWSRLYGNYSGLAQSDEDGRLAPNAGRSFDYPLRSFDERGMPVFGVLATDRTHQTKAHFLYDLPFGTSVGARWFGASGIPRTREAAFMPVQVMYRGRSSDGRLPFLSQFDIYLQHHLRVGKRQRLTLSVNVANLLNQGTATNYHATELFPGQSIAFDEAQFYRGIDTQALITEQRLLRDARFLLDSDYQAPRSIRLAVKLGF